MKITHASCLIDRKVHARKLSLVAALPRASGLLVALLPRSPSRISVEDSTRTCSFRAISSVLQDLCLRRTDRSRFYASRLSLSASLQDMGVLQQTQSFSVVVDDFQQCIVRYVRRLMLDSWCDISLQRMLLWDEFGSPRYTGNHVCCRTVQNTDAACDGSQEQNASSLTSYRRW